MLPRSPVFPLLLLLCVLAGAVAFAQEPAAVPTPAQNKLTLAFYNFSSHTEGMDINLRHTFTSSTAWVGGYHENDDFDQGRVGYEYDHHGKWLALVPSIQAATHGFVGASLYAEVGSRWYAIGGAGRTNLKPYWNLGFDPNDYVQFGAGYRDPRGTTISVNAIHDNRLDTGQTNTHFYVRRDLPRKWRVTSDVVHEHGNGDDGLVVNAWAVSEEIDWRRWFGRVAADPHVNYTPDRQLRIAGGFRF